MNYVMRLFTTNVQSAMKRSIVNADLKDTHTKSGFKGITMAQVWNYYLN